MPKRYDRAYFDRWYRGEAAVKSPAELRRKAVLAAAGPSRAVDDRRWRKDIHDQRRGELQLQVVPDEGDGCQLDPDDVVEKMELSGHMSRLLVRPTRR